MSILREPVLVLNSSWYAIDTWTLQKALTNVFSERAKILVLEDISYSFLVGRTFENISIPQNSLVDFQTWASIPIQNGKHFLRTAKSEIRIPEIIVLESNSLVKRRKISCSKANLIRRDEHVCQYCGIRIQSSEETVDHIIPQVLKGVHSWKNCVLACHHCNSKKGAKRLEECGMKLIERKEMKIRYPNSPQLWNIPYEPSWSAIFRVPISRRKESWKKFVSD